MLVVVCPSDVPRRVRFHVGHARPDGDAVAVDIRSRSTPVRREKR